MYIKFKKMKAIITNAGLAKFLFVLLFVACAHVEPIETSEEKTFMLNQSVITIEGDTIETHSRFEGVCSALIFISPACEHCQYETQALLSDHNDKPANLHLAFLSDVHPDSLKAFASQFHYDSTTVFLWDENGKISQQMGVTSYPTMFLYDTSGVNLETIVGEAKPSYVYKFYHETH